MSACGASKQKHLVEQAELRSKHERVHFHIVWVLTAALPDGFFQASTDIAPFRGGLWSGSV